MAPAVPSKPFPFHPSREHLKPGSLWGQGKAREGRLNDLDVCWWDRSGWRSWKRWALFITGGRGPLGHAGMRSRDAFFLAIYGSLFSPSPQQSGRSVKKKEEGFLRATVIEPGLKANLQNARTHAPYPILPNWRLQTNRY